MEEEVEKFDERGSRVVAIRNWKKRKGKGGRKTRTLG